MNPFPFPSHSDVHIGMIADPSAGGMAGAWLDAVIAGMTRAAASRPTAAAKSGAALARRRALPPTDPERYGMAFRGVAARRGARDAFHRRGNLRRHFRR